MSKPKSRLSAFALANRCSSIHAQISVTDVLELRPDWSEQQAAAFLSANGSIIGAAMIACGVQALANIVRRNNDAN